MLKRYRRFTGLFLIFLAAALLFAWEARGRDLVLMQDVLCARSDIQSGDLISKEMFKAVSVPRNALIKDAILSGEEERLVAKRCITDITEGAQLSGRMISEKPETKIPGLSAFVIKKDWIYMRSSSLRGGDIVEILSSDGKTRFGSFDVLYVKNESEGEVRSADTGGLNITGTQKDDRSEANSEIDHVEIETVLYTYLSLKEYAEKCTGPALLLIRREGK